MSISPVIFIIIYCLAFLLFLFFAIANFYNVIRFSFMKGAPIIVSLIFLILTVGIVLGTLSSLGEVDWDQPLYINLPAISIFNEGS